MIVTSAAAISDLANSAAAVTSGVTAVALYPPVMEGPSGAASCAGVAQADINKATVATTIFMDKPPR